MPHPIIEVCDLRKSFDGLHALVTERLQESPQSGALFVFTNRRRNRLTVPLLFLNQPMCALEPDDQRIELRPAGHGLQRLHPGQKIPQVERLTIRHAHDGIHDIIPQPVDGAGIVPHPFEREVDQPLLAVPLIRTGLDACRAHNRASFSNGAAQIQSDAAFQENTYHRRGMTAQGKGIFRARRHHADMKEGGETIQPVGQRQDLPFGRFRNRSLHRLRAILLENGLAHRRRLPVMPRVVAAHHALQFGKFSDDASQQIRFAQGAGPLTVSDHGFVQARQPGERSRQRDHTRLLLPHGSNFLVKGDAVQLSDPLL